MKRRTPKISLWILTRLSSGYRIESLAGDLAEEYAEGRSRLWLWRQVTCAVLADFFSIRKRLYFGYLLGWAIAELSGTFFLVGIVDELSETSVKGMLGQPVLVIQLGVLLAVGVLGAFSAVRFKRRSRQPWH